MPDIVYWGNGDQILGEYIAPKPVDTAISGEIQTGILVNWGGGDTVELTGELLNITTKTWRVFSWVNSCFGTCQTYHSVAYPVDPPYNWTFGSVVNTQCGSPRNNVRINAGGSSYPLRLARFLPVSNSSQCAASAASSRNLPRVKYNTGSGSPIVNGVPTPAEIDQIDERTVTSTTGQTSSRDNPPNEPTVTPIGDGCEINITFTDLTVETIPLTFCPDWVKIRTDQDCPDGTCSVECPDHICCYDCDGVAVLTISK